MAKNSRLTRSKDITWLIGHPSETIAGARLPSGRDVMKNFVFYHRIKKQTLSDSARQVHDHLLPFWIKSRLPIRQKQHIIQKIKDMYAEQVRLMSSRARSTEKDKFNQNQYTEKLNRLFDISHANADDIIVNDEDRKFLKLQQESRCGSIGTVDKKLHDREKRAAERRKRLADRGQLAATTPTQTDRCVAAEVLDSNDSSSDSSTEDEPESEEFIAKIIKPGSTRINQQNKYKSIVSKKVSSVLDRANISVRASTMIIASVVNEVGGSTSAAVPSMSTVYRHRQQRRREVAQRIQDDYNATKSVVHWDGKLLPDVTGDESSHVDRLPVLVSSVVDGNIKLLGVPKLSSGTGQSAATAVHELLMSWKCDKLIIGMCFDTTASNTGRVNGACTLLEGVIGRPLLWLACRHHMFEVLLSDAFGICFGTSTGPEILMFKRFRNNWSKIKHKPSERINPLIVVSDSIRDFILEHLKLNYPRDDYKEFLNLAAKIVGIDTKTTLRKPGALHRARWMAKAIYTLKMELLFEDNEVVLQLTASEMREIRRFNRFVIYVYLQSWLTCRNIVDAPINDILLIQRLADYDDTALHTAGLKMIKRHSWYLTPELSTLALFSRHTSPIEKMQLVLRLQTNRSEHVLKSLPHSVSDLSISRSFFQIADIDDSFLDAPVETWPTNDAYLAAEDLSRKLVCVNDCAERGVALIRTFNASITKDESQKQYLLQVIEKHRKDFLKCNRDNLMDM